MLLKIFFSIPVFQKFQKIKATFRNKKISWLVWVFQCRNLRLEHRSYEGVTKRPAMHVKVVDIAPPCAPSQIVGTVSPLDIKKECTELAMMFVPLSIESGHDISVKNGFMLLGNVTTPSAKNMNLKKFEEKQRKSDRHW